MFYNSRDIIVRFYAHVKVSMFLQTYILNNTRDVKFVYKWLGW